MNKLNNKFENRKKMKKIITLPRVMIVMMMGIFTTSCNDTGAEQKSEARKMPVKIEQTQTKEVKNNLEFTGVVQAYEEAHIAPAAPVRIQRILVDVGDKVSKGQLLVQMDRTQLFQANVQLENLEKELARLDTLLRAGAVTQQQFDQMKTQYDIAKSNIDNLSTQTEIRSPLNGVVTGRYYSDGEMFSMTPGPAGKPAIVSVFQIKPVKVMINLSERFLPQIEKGQIAQVTSDVFPNQQFTGKVNKISPVVDRMSGTFSVEIIIDNSQEMLKPGMFARVSLNMGTQDVFLVPALAVLKQAGSNERYVFVIGDDNTAIRKTVTLGNKYDDKLEILAGLEKEQRLVVTGQHNLIEGTTVEILN
jgi:RND family efflux transporter MFP subunit